MTCIPHNGPVFDFIDNNDVSLVTNIMSSSKRASRSTLHFGHKATSDARIEHHFGRQTASFVRMNLHHPITDGPDNDSLIVDHTSTPSSSCAQSATSTPRVPGSAPPSRSVTLITVDVPITAYVRCRHSRRHRSEAAAASNAACNREYPALI